MNVDKEKLKSMIDMFLNCKIRHSYTIFVKSCDDIKKISNYLKSYIYDIENLKVARSCNGTILTNLNTGAVIRIVLANEPTRGYKNWLSLYEDTLPQEIINFIIKPMAIGSICLSFNIDNLLESEE